MIGEKISLIICAQTGLCDSIDGDPNVAGVGESFFISVSSFIIILIYAVVRVVFPVVRGI